MRPTSLQACALVMAMGIAGCSDSAENPFDAPVGGTSSAGGTVGLGGTVTGTGSAQSTGGVVVGSGGTVVNTGGTMVGTGGTAAGTGGTSTTCTNVRPTGTDWDEATCDEWATETSECTADWMVTNNYCDESCGRCSTSNTGGTAGTGGGSTGGSSTGGGGTIPDNCSEGDLQVCNNGTGQHCGYTYEYWKDNGSGCLVNTSDGYSVDWSNINNLLGRKGVRPGSRSNVITYDADYNPNGNSYLTVYGWFRNPLVEYYIVDSWGSWRPPGDDKQKVGTVETDGGTYDIYKNQRTGPSIDGDTTFWQYWSVRTEKRNSGTITVGNHFSAWDNAGMTVGTFYEVSLCVEGYQSSGSATVRMSID